MKNGTKNCWDIKSCPASFYLNCNAYEQQRSCWEIKDGCLCLNDDSCDGCSIFDAHKELEAKDLKTVDN